MSDNEEDHSPMDETEETPSKSRKRSQIWNYFRILSKTLAQCTTCDRKLAYGRTTANLNRHLRLRHPTFELESCFKKDNADTPPRTGSNACSTRKTPEPKKIDSNRDAIFSAIDRKELEHLILEKESYLKSLQILKLERELGLPSSKFSAELINKSNTIYVLQDGQVMQRQVEGLGDVNLLHSGQGSVVGVQETPVVEVQQHPPQPQQIMGVPHQHPQIVGVHQTSHVTSSQVQIPHHYVTVSASNNVHVPHIVGVSGGVPPSNPHIVGMPNSNAAMQHGM